MDFKFDREYPPEFEYLQDMVNKSKEQIKQIDEYLNYILDEKGPFSEYNLWRQGLNYSERQERLVSFLNEKKVTYRNAILDKITEETAGIDPKIVHWVRQSASWGMLSYPEEDGRYAGQKARPSPKTKQTDIDMLDLDMLFPEGPVLKEANELIKEPNQSKQSSLPTILENNSPDDETIKKLMQDTQQRRQEKQHRRRTHR